MAVHLDAQYDVSSQIEYISINLNSTIKDLRHIWLSGPFEDKGYFTLFNSYLPLDNDFVILRDLDLMCTEILLDRWKIDYASSPDFYIIVNDEEITVSSSTTVRSILEQVDPGYPEDYYLFKENSSDILDMDATMLSLNVDIKDRFRCKLSWRILIEIVESRLIRNPEENVTMIDSRNGEKQLFVFHSESKVLSYFERFIPNTKDRKKLVCTLENTLEKIDITLTVGSFHQCPLTLIGLSFNCIFI